MDREERKYAEMPEREEQGECPWMLAEDLWARGTEIESQLDRAADDE